MGSRQEKIIEETILILKRFLNPSKIIIFGSRAKEKDKKCSDFDFALSCPKPCLSVERKINEAIEKVSGLYKVDIVYLDSIDDEFKKIILKTGKVVYERGA